ncbi:hypothetical protein GQ43DRAFT_377932, partial [Delitschia confertaspora ATCC 74209]
AGKDRTGALATVVLGLAGWLKRIVGDEYSLLRLGVKLHRNVLLGMLKAWSSNWDLGALGMRKSSLVKKEFMLEFMEAAEKEYGNVGSFVRGSRWRKWGGLGMC